MRRTINLKFLIGLLAVLLVLGVGLWLAYGLQVRRHAGTFLVQADKAEADGELDKAAGVLGRYLDLVPTDHDVMARYGILLDRLARSAGERSQAILVLDEVLRRRPEDAEVRRRRARLAIETGDFALAREQLDMLDKSNPDLEDLAKLRARCEEADGKFAEAAEWYKKALAHRSAEIESYQRLALLLRQYLDNREEADRVMDALIEAHSASFSAYLARAYYRKKFRSLAEARADIARASSLAPNEPRVLLAGADLASAAGDWQETRRCLARTIEVRPAHPQAYLALASLDERSGRHESALGCLRSGLKSTAASEHAALLFALADLLIAGGALEEAQPILEDLRQRGFSAPLLDCLEATRLVARARRGDRSGLDEARQRLAELAGQEHSWPRVPLLQAEINELDGNRDGAIANYRQAIALGEQRPALYQKLLRLLYRQQRYGEALQTVQELTRTYRFSGDLARLAADASLQANDPAMALALARQTVADAPNDYANHVCLGLAFWAKEGKCPDAERALRAAVKLADNLPGPWVALVQYLAATEQKDKAGTVLEQAAKKLPAEQAGLTLGYCSELIGRLDQAESHYRAALARDPKGAILVLADFLGRQQRGAEAFELCDRAWQSCAPERVAGICLPLLRKGPIEFCTRAESRLTTALEKTPQSLRLLLGLAETQFYQERFDETAGVYRQVLARQPGNIVALNNLAWLLAFQDGKTEEALRHVNRAIEIMGRVGQLLETRAVVYLADKRPELARKDLDEAMRQGATATQHFHLSRTQWESKERDQALESLRRAQSMNLDLKNLHPSERVVWQRMLRDVAAPARPDRRASATPPAPRP